MDREELIEILETAVGAIEHYDGPNTREIAKLMVEAHDSAQGLYQALEEQRDEEAKKGPMDAFLEPSAAGGTKEVKI
jgi:hypothetical protein